MRRAVILACVAASVGLSSAASAQGPCSSPGLVYTNAGLLPSSGGTLIPGSANVDDNAFVLPTPPFPLRFNGQSYTSASVSTNGVLQLGPGLVSVAFLNGSLPTGSLGTAICPFWDDLVTFTDLTATNGIYINTTGGSPNRVFEVRWQVAHITDQGNPFAFSVYFFESTSGPDFIIAYDPVATALARGSSATVGVQASASGPASTYSLNQPTIASGLNLRPGCVGSQITYQGRLVSAGVPASGTFDLGFTFVNSAGATLLPAVQRPATPVSDGLFSVRLPSPAELNTTDAFLRITVNGTTLTPDQPVGSAPAANFAFRTDRANTSQLSIASVTAESAEFATQLVPGRARIFGDAGASGNSPGIWFASPIAAPVDRAFVGQLDNSNVGFFNSSWNLLVNANGNTVLGDASGNAPPERLTVNGSIQINTGTPTAPNRLAFGPVGNLGGTAENTDAVYFERVNTGTDVTELRLAIGDNASGSGLDSLRIITNNSILERFRFQSDGNAFKPGGGTWTALSDPRAKHDIARLTGTLDKLLELRGYSFLYNDDRIAAGMARPGTQIGLMADEVARVFPDWVSTDATGTRYVTERATTALMVEALRDLRAEKDAVAARAAAAEAQIEDLRARLDRLERLLGERAGK